MIIATTPAQLAAALEPLHGDIGLVMTMGALHDGHLSLVEAARRESDHVVVSIYVNPLQFGPGEDFEAYPRDLEGDVAKLEGVDVVFAPTDESIYPRTLLVRIDPGPVATILEGKRAPRTSLVCCKSSTKCSIWFGRTPRGSGRKTPSSSR